jgi:hypothetical protein
VASEGPVPAVADDDQVDVGLLGEFENLPVLVSVGDLSYDELGREAFFAKLTGDAVKGRA